VSAGRTQAMCLLMATVAVGLSACANPFTAATLANQIILDADSSASQARTATFTAPGRWDLKYSWDCSTQRSQGQQQATGMGIIVYNADDDSTAVENPEVHQAGKGGQATLHFKLGGPYYLVVTSECTWRIQVLDKSTSR